MTGDEERARKGKDSILIVCSIVFILATCAVTGAFVYDKYIATDNTLANNGSEVKVNYTGTYYDYYGEKNAIVFDTTYASIGEDDNIHKANDFNKSAFSTLNFTIGKDSYLAGFENAIVGHKAGDTIRVKIPANSAYVAADTSKIVDCSAVHTIGAFESMPLDKFKEVYPDAVATGIHSFESLYGWDAMASYDSATNEVKITHMPIVGEKYTVHAENDKVGKLELEVTGVSSDTISFKYVLSNFIKVNSSSSDIEIRMIKVDLGTSSFYITSVTDTNSDGYADTFNCKTASEKYDKDLYFEITVVSVS